MLSLLIADDEKVIRESLAECLNWEEIGIRVVGCCANGLEALDAILDETPDIVMTDIKMPGLDGLELIEKIQDIDRDIEFIVLSGYREFDFAQKAIKLGVRRYLLKPVSEEQVLESVLDAADSCERRRSIKVTMEENKKLQIQVEQLFFDDVNRGIERNDLADKSAEAAPTLPLEEKSGNHLVKTVKSCVRRNLSDSTLSLKQIATQYAHVNVDYLSRLFVQETGEKFSHYLNRKRVEKAKQLLKCDSGKVYQIAEQVGLGHNPRYFGQVFKKYAGMTPSAYAEKQSSSISGDNRK